MTDIRIIPNYPSIAINLTHVRSLRVRQEKSPTSTTRYQLAVYSQDPEDVLMVSLEDCTSLEQAQGILRALTTNDQLDTGDWTGSPAGLGQLINELEADNAALETKLSRAGEALHDIAETITALLPDLRVAWQGTMKKIVDFAIDARKQLGLTELDLSDGMAKLLANIPTDEHEPNKIEILVNGTTHTLVEPVPKPSRLDQLRARNEGWAGEGEPSEGEAFGVGLLVEVEVANGDLYLGTVTGCLPSDDEDDLPCRLEDVERRPADADLSPRRFSGMWLGWHATDPYYKIIAWRIMADDGSAIRSRLQTALDGKFDIATARAAMTRALRALK